MIPLDRHREWYRYHHLLRDLLRAELRRREPDLIQDLHFRAAAWFEANAMPEAAIDHAQAAGDYDRVARLILELQQPVWASGRVETVLRWMEWLRDITSAEYYGAIAVHGSLDLRAPRPAQPRPSAGRPPRSVRPRRGSFQTAARWRPRSRTCARSCAATGIAEMRRDARIAWEGLSPASPYRATMLYTEGISYLLEGDLARAEPILARALDLATHAGSLPLAGLILAEQCGVAAERDDWPEVTTLARASSHDRGGPGVSATTGLAPWSMRGRAAPRRTEGDVAQARFYLGRASRLRPLLTYALPVVSVQALLEMTRSYITLADPEGAAAVLAQVHDILQQRPDLGVLPELAGQLQASLATANARAVGASSLTAAELRLLPLLATHLSYQEIGERLFVSKNTVKTQAYSAYRKLGVSSRSEAVVRTRELGLNAV